MRTRPPHDARTDTGSAGERRPRVSIIMPFLDVRPFIEEAIQSVRAQTYLDWELLLVNDGSTDGSAAVARSYAERDPERIRCLEYPDVGEATRGASAARNLAIRQARGEYIALLDADDVWLPHKLAEQVPLLDAHPEVVALWGRTVYWHGWTGLADDLQADHTPDLGLPLETVIPPPVVLTEALRGDAILPCTCSILIRRAAVDRAGAFEERFRSVFTDQVFYTKLLLSGPVYVSGAVWDRYRKHPASSVAVATRSGEREVARLAYLRWARDYLAGHGWKRSEAYALIDDQVKRLDPSPLARIRTRVRRRYRDLARAIRARFA